MIASSVPIPMRNATCRAASHAAYARPSALLASPRNGHQVGRPQIEASGNIFRERIRDCGDLF